MFWSKPSPRARLVIIDGDGDEDLFGTVFYITQDMVNIGSIAQSREGDIRIEHQTVSKRHAGIRCRDGHFEIADLGSTGGLYVSGNRVNRAILKDGDVIKIGIIDVRFDVAPFDQR